MVADRICPGKWLAEEVLFLSVSRMLALFNMSRKWDSTGNLVEPRDEMTSQGISSVFHLSCFAARALRSSVSTRSSPLRFECSITPRSAAALELVGELGDELEIDA